MSARDTRLDVLRGVTILLVVLGHCIMYAVSRPGANLAAAWVFVENVIWAFHMPLFAYLSGWATSLGRSAASPGFLAARARSVMVPYVTWTLAAVAVSVSGAWRLMSPVPGSIIGGFSPLGWGSLYAISDFYWFLPGIFACYAAWWLAHRSARPGAWMLGMTAVALLAHAYTSGTGTAPWLQGVTWLFPFFAAGTVRREPFLDLGPARWIVAAVAFSAGVWLLWPIVGAEPKWMPQALHEWMAAGGLRGAGLVPRMAAGLLAYATAGCGIVLSVTSFGLLAPTKAGGAVAALGRQSLGVYVTHPFIAALILGSVAGDVAVATVASTALALLVVHALRTTRATAVVFLGAAPRPSGQGSDRERGSR